MTTNKISTPEPNEFYPNIALYTDFEITEADRQKIFELVFYQKPIDCFCVDCGMTSVFKPDDNRPTRRSGHSRASFPISSGNEWSVNLLTTNSIYQKEFKCSRNPEHLLCFFIQIKSGKISKIGQTPALADIAEQEIKKYRKILGDTHYHELSKAVGLFAHGVGVGSFVYLRRVIENFIIKPAYENAKNGKSWDEEKYLKSRVREKIELLKSELPDFLVQNSILYSIISKGIHELTENECKEYFPVLRKCLEFVLTDLEAKRETEQKKKEMQNTLGQIAGKMK